MLLLLAFCCACAVSAGQSSGGLSAGGDGPEFEGFPLLTRGGELPATVALPTYLLGDWLSVGSRYRNGVPKFSEQLEEMGGFETCILTNPAVSGELKRTFQNITDTAVGSWDCPIELTDTPKPTSEAKYVVQYRAPYWFVEHSAWNGTHGRGCYCKTNRLHATRVHPLAANQRPLCLGNGHPPAQGDTVANPVGGQPG